MISIILLAYCTGALLFNLLVHLGGHGPLGSLPLVAQAVSLLTATLLLLGHRMWHRSWRTDAAWLFGVAAGALVPQFAFLGFSRYLLGRSGFVADNISVCLLGPAFAGLFVWAASRARQSSTGAGPAGVPIGEPTQTVPTAEAFRPSPVQRLRDPLTGALSLSLGVLLVAGTTFDAHDNATWFTGSPVGFVGGMVTIAGVSLLLHVVLTVLFAVVGMVRTSASAVGQGVVGMVTAVRAWFWPTFGVLLGGWFPWFIVHMPGNVDSDTISQLFQWLGLSRPTDHHPWFDTAVFGWFWDLGARFGDYNVGLFVFLFIQVVATAACMAWTICYAARFGLPRLARRALVGFAAFFPLFAITPAVMSKDAFAAIFWMPFLVAFLEVLRTRGNAVLRWDSWALWGLFLPALPLVLAKRTNIYLFIACVLLLLIVCSRRCRRLVAAGSAVVLVVTVVVWPKVVLPALGVAPGTSTDMLTVPLQQTARVVATHGASVPETDKEVIDRVLGYDGLAESYDPRRSDAVKGRWRQDASREDQLAYARLWVGEGFRYPGTYLAATFNNTYEYFAPLTHLGFRQGLDLSRYVPFWNATTYETTTEAQVRDVALSLRQPEELSPAREAVDGATEAVLSSTVLSTKAIYSSWIPLVMLVFAARRREWLLACTTLPLFANLAFLVASPVALSRYIIPLFYSAPLMIALLLAPQFTWRPAPESDPAP